MIRFKIFVDFAYLVPNIYIVQILQYTFSIKMIFVVVYVLKEFLDERKGNDQTFVIFIVLGIK